ncbi:mitochondrial ribosomal protein L33 [Rhipicephalus microplus]|uniref:mitochondrial ribosomal protein L33 n=1 Tax=Rhipicephalus microplus TaxID=6941 RepID=UPI003F6BABDB
MAKVKAKFILVLMESIVSKHKFVQMRARLDDKLELWKFDPYIQKYSIYKEVKKVKSLK